MNPTTEQKYINKIRELEKRIEKLERRIEKLEQQGERWQKVRIKPNDDNNTQS